MTTIFEAQRFEFYFLSEVTAIEGDDLHLKDLLFGHEGVVRLQYWNRPASTFRVGQVVRVYIHQPGAKPRISEP